MTTIQLPYGKQHLTLTLPDSLTVETLRPAEVPPAPTPIELVEQALASPEVEQAMSKPQAQSVAIAINDKTRPVPHAELLPPLLRRLEEAGFPPSAITLIIATGTHPVMPPSEYPMVLPAEIINRYPILCHDYEDEPNLVNLGTTTRHTPIWLNRRYIEADVRVVVGNIEPHQFMGFSGGVKSAVIGLAGKATINHNHAMMRDPQAKLGEFADNPARQDVEEMGRIVGIDLALNAILNDRKQIVQVLAGKPQSVMVQGMAAVKQLSQVAVESPFEVMLVSPGGHPKDINLYQTQKGLAHARMVTKAGGIIIMAAACPEGTGSQKYEAWMQGVRSHQAVFEKFEQEGFRVGPHKAFQISRDASQVQVLLKSEMPPEFVRRLLLTPVDSLESAWQAIESTLPPAPRIGVMPLANVTIPLLR